MARGIKRRKSGARKTLYSYHKVKSSTYQPHQGAKECAKRAKPNNLPYVPSHADKHWWHR